MYGDHEYDAIYDIGENRDFEDHDDFFVSITQYIMMMVTRMGVAGFTYAGFNYHLFYPLRLTGYHSIKHKEEEEEGGRKLV